MFDVKKIALLLALVAFCDVVCAEVYIYRGPNGERMVTDRPPHASEDYELISRRDTLSYAGHIMANRPVPSSVVRFGHYIKGASTHFNVDPKLVAAVIQVESGFNPNAVSPKGATGLMQLMQKTAYQYNVSDRFDPRENIYAGVQHLSHLMNRFNGKLPLVLAAYNAGSSAVEAYDGIPPYPETRRYVIKVMNFHNQYLQTSFDRTSY
jgi:hypothetical protein